MHQKMRYNFTERWKNDTKRKKPFQCEKMILFKKLKQFKRTKLYRKFKRKRA